MKQCILNAVKMMMAMMMIISSNDAMLFSIKRILEELIQKQCLSPKCGGVTLSHTKPVLL